MSTNESRPPHSPTTGSSDSLLKNVALAIAIQLVIVIIIWVSTASFSPALDSLFEKMIYFYWPILYLVDNVLGPQGEFGAILLGLPLGIAIYGIVIGFAISLIKRALQRS